MTDIDDIDFDIGSLYHRFFHIRDGIKNEPECKFIDDLFRFIKYGEKHMLGGTLMKAEDLLTMYEKLRVEPIRRKIQAKHRNITDDDSLILDDLLDFPDDTPDIPAKKLNPQKLIDWLNS